MDTLRDKHVLEQMWGNGAARWKVKDTERPGSGRGALAARDRADRRKEVNW